MSVGEIFEESFIALAYGVVGIVLLVAGYG